MFCIHDDNESCKIDINAHNVIHKTMNPTYHFKQQIKKQKLHQTNVLSLSAKELGNFIIFLREEKMDDH